jgi:hypothetical protein
MSAGLKKCAAGWHVNLVLLPQETWQTHSQAVKTWRQAPTYTYLFLPRKDLNKMAKPDIPPLHLPENNPLPQVHKMKVF